MSAAPVSVKMLVGQGVPGHLAETIVRRMKNYPDVPVDEVLGDFPQIAPDTAVQIIAAHTGAPPLKLADVDWGKIPLGAVSEPPSPAAVPVRSEQNTITVAAANPASPQAKKYANTLLLKNKSCAIQTVVADRFVRHRVMRMFLNDDAVLDKLRGAVREAERGGESAGGAQGAKLLAVLEASLRAAVLLGASDIQFLATEHFGHVQFKIEGTGHIVAEMRRETYDRLMNKMVADFKVSPDSLNEKSTEADVTALPGISPEIFANFNFRCQITRPETRASKYTVATIRILSRNMDILSFRDAGFQDAHVKKIRHITESIAGLVVIVGPVNSGKSTTLFGMLSQIDPVRRLVKTIENPIEFRCPLWEQNGLGGGAIKTAQDEQNAYRNQIRAMVRKSPDCLLVGEMRSPEEAKEIVGLSYASTLCFTSIHAENVANAIGRMAFWGVAPGDLVNILRLVIAQRLVRGLCPKCREEETRPEYLSEYRHFVQKSKKKAGTIYAARRGGCDFCRHTGFFGRHLIVEMLSYTDESLSVASIRNTPEIQKDLDARCESLWFSGMAKVHAGKASVGEIIRHTGRRAGGA